MSCEFSKEQLIDYIYEEMITADREGFQMHLRDCPSCREEVTVLSETSVLLRSWRAEESNLKLVFATESVPQRPSLPFGWKRFIESKPAVALLGAALVLFLALAANAFNFISVSIGDPPPAGSKVAGGSNSGTTAFDSELHNNAAPNRFLNQQRPNFNRPTPGFHTEHGTPYHSSPEMSSDFFPSAHETQIISATGGEIESFYIEGEGSVFIIRPEKPAVTQLAHDFRAVAEQYEKVRVYVEELRKKRARDPQWKPEIAQFNNFPSDAEAQMLQTRIARLVDEHRQTLEPLGPSDELVFAVELAVDSQANPSYANDGNPAKPVNEFIFQVSKEDLEKFSRGPLNLDEFLRRANIRKFPRD